MSSARRLEIAPRRELPFPRHPRPGCGGTRRPPPTGSAGSAGSCELVRRDLLEPQPLRHGGQSIALRPNASGQGQEEAQGDESAPLEQEIDRGRNGEVRLEGEGHRQYNDRWNSLQLGDLAHVRLLDRYLLRQLRPPLLFAFTAMTSIMLLNQVARRFGAAGGQGTALVGDRRGVSAVPALHHRDDPADGGADRDALHLQPPRGRQRDHRDAGQRGERTPNGAPALLAGVHAHRGQLLVHRPDPARQQRQAPQPADQHSAQEADARAAGAGDQRNPALAGCSCEPVASTQHRPPAQCDDLRHGSHRRTADHLRRQRQ